MFGCRCQSLGAVGRALTWTFIRYSTRPMKITKAKSSRKTSKYFVDFKRVRATGGKGGDGRISFLSMPLKEWAGPDGGNGGNGGHVIFEANRNKNSLEHMKSLYKAENGTNGASKCCHGKDAPNLSISVPVGTVFRDEKGIILADLKKEGEIYVAARGGAGGKGNHFFLSNEDRAPMVFEEGGKPETKRLDLELRIVAHVGLVGFPNAGKSTLLRAISRAKPKVAAYPFTTLRPHVGIVEYEDYEQVAVADIPGLIKGAHMNYGLGFSFLRHIERCVCLLYVLDLSVEEPWTQLSDLQHELEQYQEGLSHRPHAIVANKIDIPRAKTNLEELRQRVPFEVLPVSAKRKINVEELLIHVRKLYDDPKND